MQKQKCLVKHCVYEKTFLALTSRRSEVTGLNTTLHCNALQCTHLIYTSLAYTALHLTTRHYTILHYPTLNCTTMHTITLLYLALYGTALHYSTLHEHCPILNCTAKETGLQTFLCAIPSLLLRMKCLRRRIYSPPLYVLHLSLKSLSFIDRPLNAHMKLSDGSGCVKGAE